MTKLTCLDLFEMLDIRTYIRIRIRHVMRQEASAIAALSLTTHYTVHVMQADVPLCILTRLPHQQAKHRL